MTKPKIPSTPLARWTADDVALPVPLATRITTETTGLSGFIITSADAYREAAERVLGLKALQREVTGWFKPLRDAANALRASLLSREADIARPIAAAIDTLESEMLAWRRLEQARVDTEAARQRAEAEAAAKADQQRAVEALRAAAKAAADPETRGALRQQATVLAKVDVLPPPVVVPSEVPDVSGLHVMTTWRCEVDDLAALVRAVAAGKVPLDALEPNTRWLNGQARALRTAFAIPGCRAVSSESLVGRGR